MVFSSLGFLFFFCPLVLIVYFFITPKYANLWLLLASLFFYYLGDKEHVQLLIYIIVIAYLSGIIMQKSNNRIAKKYVFYTSLLLMLGAMAYYKYWNFIIENLNILFKINLEHRNITFPIGISFFTFQAVSYVVDIYRGEKALKNPIDMALYISFFPQLIAGPIVRFHDIRKYMDQIYRKIKIENIENGIWRFCIGLTKKVLLANNLGGLADIVFGVKNISQCSILYTWLGAVAYTLQIYYDFSGYSDMAIGLGKIFGFEFQENFNYPYTANSIKDFWRRWHISLSQFFRDYVYIPLGGNKCSSIKWGIHIVIVWLLTGLWHGASWNYIFWGLFYGILLLTERFILCNVTKSYLPSCLSRILRHIYTMGSVTLLWVLFRTNSLTHALSYTKNMFGIDASSFIDRGFIFQIKNFGLLLAIAIIFCVPIFPKIEKMIGEKEWFQWIKTAALSGCVLVSVSYIYMGNYNPFLYFMF